jgi:hypothetical protein
MVDSIMGETCSKQALFETIMGRFSAYLNIGDLYYILF